VELKCQTDVVVVEGVEWIWGLTCDFWAEKWEKKILGRQPSQNKGVRSGMF
jgi:hypothetical protein